MGTPMLPNATGAVFAMRQTSTARRGSKPRPTSRKAVIATGAPKPALPSSSAPKQKATRIACTARSPGAQLSIQRRSFPNEPVSFARL